MKKSYSIICLFHGTVALIAGIIHMMIVSNTRISGYARHVSSRYARIADDIELSSELINILIAVGVVFIILSIVFNALKHTEKFYIKVLLLILPLIVILIYVGLCYLPIIQYYILL